MENREFTRLTPNYRRPAVVGRFYPAEPDKLTRSIREFLEPPQERIHAIGLIVPHAGYMYSGHVAGAVYARVDLPQRNIVLCPNHTGLGTPLSIMKSGAWQTRSEEHTSELQSQSNLVCRLLLEKKKEHLH